MAKRKRPSSRLVRNEKKRLMRQTMIFGSVALVLGLLFLFLILPGFIRIVNGIFGTSVIGEPEDTLPPQPPVISAPVPATNSAELSITGYTEADSTVVLLLNGLKEDETVAEEGEFEFDLELEEGENSLAAYAVDLAGNESSRSKSYRVVLDTERPSLEIESPESGAEFLGSANRTITVSGATEPDAKVYINGRLTTADKEGSFSYRLYLDEGENTIEVRAVDKGGNEISEELKVSFRR